MATGGQHGQTSDEIFDFTCSPCADQNRNREAVRYCVECQDYYCQSCTDMHKMFPAMRGHILLNKTDFNSSGQQSNLPPVPTERCYIHKTKLIDMYCGDHDEVCCTSCVAENHRNEVNVIGGTDFSDNPQLREVLSEMKALGEIKRHEKCRPDPRKKVYKIKKTQELNAKLPSDKLMCNIMSCRFDVSGNLLLIDINNNSLKRVSLQKKTVTDYCMMPGAPVAVCCVNKEEAAVSMCNRSIQFVSIRDQMKITRQVKLDHKCWGLACSDGKMYVTDEGKKLYIYDISGKLIRIIEQDNVGNDICLNNRYVTFDRYSKKVYIADIYKGLVSFTDQGEYISSFTDKMISLPQCACSDGRGSVFVCCWNSRNVLQIGADGQFLGEVVGKSHGLGSIWSVCFNENKKRLVVTIYRSDKIHIFDLE